MPFTDNVLLLQRPYKPLNSLYMNVTVLQTDIHWASIAANTSAVDDMLDKAEARGAAPADLYVLPEMWATGFHATSPQAACSPLPLEWMQSAADRLRAAVCGSVAVKAVDGTFRNRQYFVLPDGSFYYYDKRHLFSYGGEDRFYKAGGKRTVAVYGGIRFLLLTCYDLRFPVWMRYDGDYDAIIVVANWPESRSHAWHTLLRARAIENQCYVIGANRTGCDPLCSYAGGSAIIDAKGLTLAQAEGKAQQAVSAAIDIEALRRFRSKFPVLDDRDRQF